MFRWRGRLLRILLKLSIGHNLCCWLWMLPSLSFSSDKHLKKMLTGFSQVHVLRGLDCRSLLAAGAWGQSMNGGGWSCGRTGVKKVSSPFLGNLFHPRRKTKILILVVPPTKQLSQFPLQWKPQMISLSHSCEDSNLVSVLLCVCNSFIIILYSHHTTGPFKVCKVMVSSLLGVV